ncbi:unnamed protein product [Anisakis simplex]|uniref:Uncharacterized protein n=1 Tax=Anisakis simplex TaxID=6269 RepID=A0A3P6NPP2_ANISI|nr:unnamed protein product [Anisakis simplex]
MQFKVYVNKFKNDSFEAHTTSAPKASSLSSCSKPLWIRSFRLHSSSKKKKPSRKSEFELHNESLIKSTLELNSNKTHRYYKNKCSSHDLSSKTRLSFQPKPHRATEAVRRRSWPVDQSIESPLQLLKKAKSTLVERSQLAQTEFEDMVVKTYALIFILNVIPIAFVCTLPSLQHHHQMYANVCVEEKKAAVLHV